MITESMSGADYWNSQSDRWVNDDNHFLYKGYGARKWAIHHYLYKSRAQITEANRILNVGSAGSSGVYLPKEVNQNIYSTDFARRSLVLDESGHKVVADFNQGLPFRDESFDMVFGFFIMRYASNPDFTVGEMLRVLNPQGKLILIDHTQIDHPEEVNIFVPFEIPLLKNAEVITLQDAVVSRTRYSGPLLGVSLSK